MTTHNLGLKRPLLRGQVNFPVCLAPMVGLSHVGLRMMARAYLPAGAQTIWPTEMLSSWRLPKEQLGESPETRREIHEPGLVPQILGNEPGPIQESVARLKDWGAEGIDINMGCPVRKALRHNYGVALMGDPDYAAEVVSMARGSLPVSVKLRAGLQGDFQYLVQFCRGLETAGAEWLCLHPRRAEQKRRGHADWAQIGALSDQLKIALIGNGDVQTSVDVLAMLNETGCDSVMVGRALTARPWLLWQVGEELGWPPPPGRDGEAAPRTPEEEGKEYGRAHLLLLSVLERHFSVVPGLKRLNFHVRNSHPWLEFGHALSARLSRAQTYAEARVTLEEFFSSPQRMHSRTDLRY